VVRAEGAAGKSAPAHVAAMFGYSHAMHDAQREWLADFLAGASAPAGPDRAPAQGLLAVLGRSAGAKDGRWR
jgi:hypothetical protein